MPIYVFVLAESFLVLGDHSFPNIRWKQHVSEANSQDDKALDAEGESHRSLNCLDRVPIDWLQIPLSWCLLSSSDRLISQHVVVFSVFAGNDSQSYCSAGVYFNDACYRAPCLHFKCIYSYKSLLVNLSTTVRNLVVGPRRRFQNYFITILSTRRWMLWMHVRSSFSKLQQVASLNLRPRCPDYYGSWRQMVKVTRLVMWYTH